VFIFETSTTVIKMERVREVIGQDKLERHLVLSSRDHWFGRVENWKLIFEKLRFSSSPYSIGMLTVALLFLPPTFFFLN
jgi:hypothetical protein